MSTFMYTIQAPMGLHARHAGMLVKESSKYKSKVTVSKGDSSANGKGILSLMGLRVMQGEVITVTVDGSDEDTASRGLKSFLYKNL